VIEQRIKTSRENVMQMFSKPSTPVRAVSTGCPTPLLRCAAGESACEPREVCADLGR
jgi:hypothetical protein